MTITEVSKSPTSTSKLSIEAFLRYDDGSQTHYELKDGVLIDMGAESTINTLISGFLFAAFLQMGLPSYRIGFKQWIAVSSEAATARDPDLLIHSPASFAAIEGTSQALLKADAPAPLLVVEVVSPGKPGEANYDRDYVDKRQEYAERGIPEYWIVDPSRQVVLVLTLKGGIYGEAKFSGATAVNSPSFPQLALTAQQIFQAGR